MPGQTAKNLTATSRLVPMRSLTTMPIKVAIRPARAGRAAESTRALGLHGRRIIARGQLTLATNTVFRTLDPQTSSASLRLARQGRWALTVPLHQARL